MLPRANRLTVGEDFRRAIRTGRRSGSETVVVHGCLTEGGGPPRMGFVVNKAVGSAVERNLVKRRLRHLCGPHLAGLPVGSLVVVRALPASASASFQQLGTDLSGSLARVVAGWAA